MTAAAHAIKAGAGKNNMNRLVTGTMVFVLLSLPAQAAERITGEQIQQVINATDAAANEPRHSRHRGVPE